MDIAIVGAGISGLVAARRLGERHRVTLFEAAPRLGGHANTVRVEIDGAPLDVDTGFIVYNDTMYPRFTALLAQLGVASKPTTMGFGVRCDRTGIEYGGESSASLFADPRNALRPSFWRMLRDIARFRREAPRALETMSPAITVGEFLTAAPYGPLFGSHYLLPLGAALWSCAPGEFRRFPMEFVVEFLRNHSMLGAETSPWRTIVGGSRRYVDALAARLRAAVRTGCAVRRVTRRDDGVTVTSAAGDERFDEVVFACHADTALAALADADAREREFLNAFPYRPNEAVLHLDANFLPRRRLARSSWNCLLNPVDPERAWITYDLTKLQGLPSRRPILVTLNVADRIAPASVLGRFQYDHPVAVPGRRAFQGRHAEVIRSRRVSFCGAYWGFGFHEDGVASAERVAAAFESHE